MIDCSKEIGRFHDEGVRLPQASRTKLRECREANENRLKSGLQKAGQPAPLRFVKQGSYAMLTTILQPNNDYDIDDGVLFSKKDLQGAQGADKSSLDARQMVCDALQDKVFAKKPEIRTNCVRVFYNEGHHVDIPVYRIENPDSSTTLYELASTEWKVSNPEGVSKWFEQFLESIPSETDGHHVRSLVRLLKAFAISRASWKMPSGLINTVLTLEGRPSYAPRLDTLFYGLIQSISARLKTDLVVRHPVVPKETITKTSNDANMEEMRDRLAWAIDRLSVLHNGNCTRKEALKAWADVFYTSFFDGELKESALNQAPYVIARGEPKAPVQKEGGGRFG